MQVEVTWVEGMEFRADAESGHSWNMDASVEVGGNDLGPRPTEMLLSAVGIPQLPSTGLRFEVFGQRAVYLPCRFSKIKLHYVVTGEGLSEERVARAVQLSTEKYCSVLSSLNAEVTYGFEVVQA